MYGSSRLMGLLFSEVFLAEDDSFYRRNTGSSMAVGIGCCGICLGGHRFVL